MALAAGFRCCLQLLTAHGAWRHTQPGPFHKFLHDNSLFRPSSSFGGQKSTAPIRAPAAWLPDPAASGLEIITTGIGRSRIRRASEIEPVHFGHFDIQRQHVRIVRLDHFPRDDGVGRNANHFEIGRGIDDLLTACSASARESSTIRTLIAMLCFQFRPVQKPGQPNSSTSPCTLSRRSRASYSRSRQWAVSFSREPVFIAARPLAGKSHCLRG